MKAILMCAGKSTRTLPLTQKVPKPLLKIINKTIIEHTLDQLVGTVSTVIIVVGYLKEQIIEHLTDSYRGVKIIYEIQESISGTGSAVYGCEKYFKEGESFLVLNGDDLYSSRDIKKLTEVEIGILAMKVANPSNYGVLQVDDNSYLTEIVEKPQIYIGDLVNSGCYKLNFKIFSYLSRAKKSERGEIELTAAIQDFTSYEDNKFKIIAIEDFWFPINYPSTYLDANMWYLRNKVNFSEINPLKDVSKFAHIGEKVYIGKNSSVSAHCSIEGPVYIGDNCRIRCFNIIYPNTIILDNSELFNCSLGNSLILSNSNVSNYLYRGVITNGEDINIENIL